MSRTETKSFMAEVFTKRCVGLRIGWENVKMTDSF
jgi:hypothetical protein